MLHCAWMTRLKKKMHAATIKRDICKTHYCRHQTFWMRWMDLNVVRWDQPIFIALLWVDFFFCVCLPVGLMSTFMADDFMHSPPAILHFPFSLYNSAYSSARHIALPCHNTWKYTLMKRHKRDDMSCNFYEIQLLLFLSHLTHLFIPFIPLNQQDRMIHNNINTSFKWILIYSLIYPV